MQAVENVLNKLRDALGTGESPDGSNHNFITEWYNANVDKIGNGPWCEMTNTWSCWTSGAKAIKSGRAYTVYAAEDGIKGVNGSWWHWGTAGMRAGDQVYYDWMGTKGNAANVDHTGTVERILGDGTFYVLEGNTTGNQLRRQRRDGKFVVGYVRLDYASLGAPSPQPHKPATKGAPTPSITRALQSIFEIDQDTFWGSETDEWALRVRTAARAHLGYPKNVKRPFREDLVQKISGTTVDNQWGPKSQAALVSLVKRVQRALGVTADGQWGPQTDNAFLAIRKRNLNNF